MTNTDRRSGKRIRVTSTMQEVPLSIGTIVRYGTSIYGDTPIYAYDGSSVHRATFRGYGARGAQLAHGLVEQLQVDIGEPVATLLWNTREAHRMLLRSAAHGCGSTHAECSLQR